MAEYFLEPLATQPASFQVHEKNCADLQPKINETRYLGSYGNATAPLNKALGLHSHVDFCPTCLKS